MEFAEALYEALWRGGERRDWRVPAAEILELKERHQNEALDLKKELRALAPRLADLGRPRGEALFAALVDFYGKRNEVPGFEFDVFAKGRRLLFQNGQAMVLIDTTRHFATGAYRQALAHDMDRGEEHFKDSWIPGGIATALELEPAGRPFFPARRAEALLDDAGRPRVLLALSPGYGLDPLHIAPLKAVGGGLVAELDDRPEWVFARRTPVTLILPKLRFRRKENES